ncbi:UrcA family protein [Hirschia litorea]|uniref:UrcA family protein n=1 Tax=Hirschia litorea TaxID=1199156 RepID=A0ABW2IK23_9PROT
MKNLTSTITAAAFIATSVAVIGLTAPIASAQDAVAFEFNYSVDELQTEAGTQQVLDRLETSAKRACDTGNRRLTLSDMRVKNACVSTVMHNAMEEISAPALIAQYKAAHKTG